MSEWEQTHQSDHWNNIHFLVQSLVRMLTYIVSAKDSILEENAACLPGIFIMVVSLSVVDFQSQAGGHLQSEQFKVS